MCGSVVQSKAKGWENTWPCARIFRVTILLPQYPADMVSPGSSTFQSQGESMAFFKLETSARGSEWLTSPRYWPQIHQGSDSHPLLHAYLVEKCQLTHSLEWIDHLTPYLREASDTTLCFFILLDFVYKAGKLLTKACGNIQQLFPLSLQTQFRWLFPFNYQTTLRLQNEVCYVNNFLATGGVQLASR